MGQGLALSSVHVGVSGSVCRMIRSGSKYPQMEIPDAVSKMAVLVNLLQRLLQVLVSPSRYNVSGAHSLRHNNGTYTGLKPTLITLLKKITQKQYL